ncbi:extracellular solute-binding protein [Nonomuraea sp. NPDC000554]|uniref:ABC transporter substrate-binding protein n=1 Tax=Nonomuraea sp. NPDC000554 TaxID=3154259 RepID=UPI003332E8A5
MRTRTPVAVTLAIVLALAGAAGCTTGDSTSSSASNATLTVALWTNPGAIEFTKQLNAEFEKAHPGVTVKLQSTATANGAWAQLSNSLLQAKSVDVLARFAPTQGGFPPEYTKIQPAGAAALITANQLTDLKDQPFMKHYDAATQAAAVGYKGGVYGVMAASYAAAGAIWYKKDLLAQYGIAVPTTFQEFLDACAKLKKAGKTPIFLSGKVGMQGGIWQGIENQLMMKGRGATESVQISADRAKAFWDGTQKWTDPIYKEVGARYAKVMQYVVPTASGIDQQTAPGVWAVKTDDYPFLVDGSWDGLTIQQANPKLNLGFFTLPGTDDPAANRVAFKPDLTWVVPASAPHKDLAMQWLTMFSEPENYQEWLRLTGSLSAQPALKNTGLPWMDWLNQHSEGSFTQLTPPWTPAGAPLDAMGPDFYKLAPIGTDSLDTILSRSASAYAKSAGR